MISHSAAMCQLSSHGQLVQGVSIWYYATKSQTILIATNIKNGDISFCGMARVEISLNLNKCL